jgi:hypothetical protein
MSRRRLEAVREVFTMSIAEQRVWADVFSLKRELERLHPHDGFDHFAPKHASRSEPSATPPPSQDPATPSVIEPEPTADGNGAQPLRERFPPPCPQRCHPPSLNSTNKWPPDGDDAQADHGRARGRRAAPWVGANLARPLTHVAPEGACPRSPCSAPLAGPRRRIRRKATADVKHQPRPTCQASPEPAQQNAATCCWFSVGEGVPAGQSRIVGPSTARRRFALCKVGSTVGFQQFCGLH